MADIELEDTLEGLLRLEGLLEKAVEASRIVLDVVDGCCARLDSVLSYT